MSNTDPEIIKWTCVGLDALGFDYVLEPVKRPNGMVVVRLRGGLKEAMRFFLATDPAITRKRSIEGEAVKSDAKLRVTAIEPLGLELPMYDITTGTGDFIANGVVSHNCFARNTHTYLDLDAGQDFNSKVVVKVNAPELLRAKLRSRGWPGEHIAMGTNVDCYQRAEGRYQLMRGIIAALRDAANPFSILTKGTLILRDLDLLLEAAEVTDVGLNVSAGLRRQRPVAGHRAGHARAAAAARRVRRAQRRRAALRRADGADRAVPVRLPRAARGGRPAGGGGGRGRTSPRSCCTCGRVPASGSSAGSARRTRPWSPGTPSCTGAARTRARTTSRGSRPRSASSRSGTASGAATCWPSASGAAAERARRPRRRQCHRRAERRYGGRQRGGRARAARALLTIDQHRSKLNRNALPASNHLPGKWMAPGVVRRANPIPLAEVGR